MKRISALLVVLLLTAWLGGCAALARHSRYVLRQEMKRSLVYFRDARTGLCFAATEYAGLVTISCERMPKQ